MTGSFFQLAQKKINSPLPFLDSTRMRKFKRHKRERQRERGNVISPQEL